MAIYYVDATATGAADGSSWTDAFTTIQSGVSAATTAGDVVKIACGTYAETLNSVANGTAAAPIRWERALSPIQVSGDIYLNQYGLSDANGGIDILHDYIEINGPIRVTSDDGVTRSLYQRAGADNLSIRDMDLIGSQEVFSSGENLKIYRSKFRGLSLVNTGQNTATFSWNLDRGAYFEGCVFSPGYVDGVGWVRPTKFRVRDTSAAGRETTFNNCVLDGYWNHIFDVEHTTATLNLNNTILGSYNWGIGATRASPVYFTLAGTVNAVNVQRLCYWKGQEFSLASGAAGTLNETNTITNQGLGFVEHNTALGGLAFTVDDGDTDNMQYVADLLASLDASAGEVFTWFPDQRSIAGTPPAGYSTYQELYQAVVAAGHEIGCAGLTGGALDGLSESAFKVDVTAAKTWIEETVGGGYEVKTFSWPGGATNSNMQGWLQELGFIGARTSAATQSTLNSVNLFEIETWAQPSENAIFSPSTTEANMLNQGVATAQGSRGHGTISTVLSHNATELPVAVATPFLQGAARTGYLKTFGALVQEYLDNSNTTTVDGVNYTNIMADYGDYSLQSDAYGIGTGAKYWSGPEPVGLDGEPFSDIDTDIGIIQSTASPFHPVNL